ncbi:adenylate/guanylate cyclase domain-containing protein [Turneriella parva]|uniref:Adenylate/guanylate cyclase n=1 Tax=Turneriella parva (strain ATCC BAA-1111 / DSM 21527 / NCTC 11395 / H) TaxID=869212 RepID=I4BBM3_TURPD|nr:adenylate/guanylate cyclase domain-containing protein [Turneriella parva]AFM14680.1 adenylate/guanylate cyclase [Turneriella parva DSM 21527]
MNAFRTKATQLKQYPALPAASVDRFAEILESSDDWQLYRINPLAFAEEHGYPEEAALDLFIHAARVGLVDFSYNMICPRCGGVAHAHHELDEVESTDFYCAVCTSSSPATLDDQVEVSFAIHPAVRKLNIDPLADLASYNRFHFSQNYIISDELRELRRQLIRHFVVLTPDASKRIVFKKAKHSTFQLISIETNTSLLINLGQADGSVGSAAAIPFSATGFAQKELASTASALELTVHNNTRARVGLMVATPDLPRILEVVARHPTRIRPFLTAKMLLNNQTFRELYKIQHLSKNLNLNIKSLTIMFTDLRGSTEMYDRAGDVFAYSLVQEHFRILTASARKFRGAIIKTMGDAIMATFSTPADGMFAALDMLKEIERLNESIKADGFEIGLKVGLHEGPALAVMRDERLDYFGQTVNIAARVQGLAAAGEICVTPTVAEAPGARALASEAGLTAEAENARLKGVGQETLVFRFAQRGAAA